MALPRIKYAFGYFGDLRIASLVIFIFILVISGYFTNKYLGMYIHCRVLNRNTGNFNQFLVDTKIKADITVSEKGSFCIGSVAAIYFIASVHGLVAILVDEVHILITPMILLPLEAFIMLMLLFFDLGVQESSGFFFFWVISGFVIKIVMAGASIYFFIVVFSYYMEVTQGPSGVEKTTPRSPPKWFPRLSSGEPKAKAVTPPTSPAKTSSPRISPTLYPLAKKITTPPRPPSPKLLPLRPSPPKSPPRAQFPRQKW